LVFSLSLLIGLLVDGVPSTWTGVAVAGSGLLIAGLLGRRAARSRQWGLQHLAAAAGGVVLGRAVLAFTYFPLVGEVSALRKYSHNIVLLVVVAAIGALALRAAGRATAEGQDSGAVKRGRSRWSTRSGAEDVPP
jgi:hypothetical protein